VLAAAALAWGCAAHIRAPAADPADYAFPASRPGEVRPEESQRIEKAWRAVLSGDPGAGEREFQKVLERRPGLLAAETGIGYARLRSGRLLDAAAAFEAVLRRRPDYVPALVGAAGAARRQGDTDAALNLYRRAAAVDPRDPSVRKRLAEVKVQVTERHVASARTLVSAGEVDRAVEEYRQALDAAPEVTGLRLEMADVLVRKGDTQAAVSVLSEDPSHDRNVLARLGDLYAETADLSRALDAYRRILARDPRDGEAQRRASEIRETLEMQQMPEEYRRIATAPRITRADLAALVAVKVTALARAPTGEPRVAVDISGSWAREHIIKALSLDILDVYPNHTFQPGAIVRRADLARAAASVLDLLKYPPAPRPEMTDMPPTNLYHDAAGRVVAAGLLELTPSGAFEAWRPVSGQEATAVVEALVRLVGP
jgi:tetratricopeptide (TPR) repeat protein